MNAFAENTPVKASSNSLPKISVVMPTYNRVHLMEQAVESILNQTFSDFEFLIIDDCSTDQTWAVLRKLSELDDRMKLLQMEENVGPYIARNRAIEMAQGKYMAVVDDDDISIPQRFERQLQVLESDTRIGIVGSRVVYIDIEGKVNGEGPEMMTVTDTVLTGDEVFEFVYARKGIIPHPTWMMRAELMRDVKYYPSKRGAWDRVLCLQLAALDVNFYVAKEALVLYRRGEEHNQLTSNKLEMHRNRLAKNDVIRGWLTEKGIHRFDHLHLKARATLLLSLAYQQRGLSRLASLVKGFTASPLFTLTQFLRFGLKTFPSNR